MAAHGGTVTRAAELHALMLAHGMVPLQPSYEALIQAYLRAADLLRRHGGRKPKEVGRGVEKGGVSVRGIKGGVEEQEESAWELYCHMQQFAEYKPTASLQAVLFEV